MLHVQETFTHNNNLMLQSPINVMVQPQPSNSSRSTKVIEQLNDRYESIQKDICAIRAQLDLVCQAKLQNEKDNITYINANKVYRVRIKEIMGVLEVKQKILESTKGSSGQLEMKVKQLKDEALASRRQLEDLRRREQVLEHDRDIAVRENNQLKHQQELLYESIEQMKMRCEREMNLLTKEYTDITEQTKYITERNEYTIELINLKLKQRRRYIEHISLMKRQLRSNTEAFVEQVRSNLDALKTDVQQTTIQTNNCTFAATQCRSEVNGLLSKIKSIAAEFAASQEKN